MKFEHLIFNNHQEEYKMNFENGFSLLIAKHFGNIEALMIKDNEVVFDDDFNIVFDVTTEKLLDLIKYVSSLDKNHQVKKHFVDR